MYKEDVKLRAFYLFLLGENYENTARILREEFGSKTSPNTVKAWAEKANDNGETWEDRRTAVSRVTRKHAEHAAEGKLAEIKDMTNNVINSLYHKMMNDASAPPLKTFEGAAYALKTMCDFALLIDQKQKGEKHPMLIVQSMLEVFREIPEVRKAISKNWDSIQDKIRERLLEDKTGEPA